MYHRVASPEVDPWRNSVSPENFAGQLQVLSDMVDVVPLEDLPGSLRIGRRSRPVAAITFDDGYVDNLKEAKPLLDRFGMSATVFVPTRWIGDPRPMWWDRLAHALLAVQALPGRLDLQAAGQDCSWQEPRVALSGQKGDQARNRLHQDIWSRMRSLPDDAARHEVLDCLVNALGTDESPLSNCRPMTRGELRELVRDGRIAIGSHTATHPELPALDWIAKAWEIAQSAEHLNMILGETPSLFAYPYGEFDDESAELARQAGFKIACTTHRDMVWANNDPLRLPRIGVSNMSPDAFRLWLRWYWLA